MNIVFDELKNRKLKKERNVTFEMVIEKMAKGEILLDFEHPNKEKYPNQRIMVIELNGYPCCVPYIQTNDEIVLKTIFPDRRFKKLLKKGDKP
ncbi:DUF4258 domain-containing protein [Hippea maritima]|uniref:Toxin n=1 Tax=Hippea maritima (strain ATCC 700847 / DSM 10411 / MH2) TaxID=760142 RepID=F2LV80_HIPMA|nr:DUF4258 domain-containing protein [Hippea maritima]AEA33664.1 hypothetical protein Hipma_0694 [Hippea maritima DSM 10411]